MNSKKSLFVALAMMAGTMMGYAQYPQQTDESAEAYKKVRMREDSLSKQAWEKAYPIIMQEAAEGRPALASGGKTERMVV